MLRALKYLGNYRHWRVVGYAGALGMFLAMYYVAHSLLFGTPIT